MPRMKNTNITIHCRVHTENNSCDHCLPKVCTAFLIPWATILNPLIHTKRYELHQIYNADLLLNRCIVIGASCKHLRHALANRKCPRIPLHLYGPVCANKAQKNV